MKVEAPPVLYICCLRRHLVERAFSTFAQRYSGHRIYVSFNKIVTQDQVSRDKNQDVQVLVEEYCRQYGWNLQIKTGCENASDSIVKAIDWLFENEDRGIVLEEDCFVEDGFLTFAAECLEMYEGNVRIGSVSSNCFTPDVFENEVCKLSRIPLIWGWATWRNRWEDFRNMTLSMDSNIRSLDEMEQSAQSKERRFAKYWKKLFKSRSIDNPISWDHRFSWHCLERELLCIVPYRNMCTNEGFGSDAVNTQLGISHLPKVGAGTMSQRIISRIEEDVCNDLQWQLLKRNFDVSFTRRTARKIRGWFVGKMGKRV